MTRPLGALSLAIIAACGSTAVMAETNTTFTYGGFIKLEAMHSDFSAGRVGTGAGRDFYVPSSIPVGNGDSYSAFDAHAKQTRFNFGTTTTFDNGEKIQTFLEMDFMVTVDGNERVTNGYEPELRHAWVKWGNWLAGQSWSNFQDVSVLPEAVDFIGPSESTVFVRQPQLRYTNGAFSFSLENPETTVNPFQSNTSVATDDNALPDVTVRYTHKTSWGHIGIAGLLRQLGEDNGAFDSTETGFGVSLSSKIVLNDRNDLRMMVNYGSGIGRYVGINTIQDAVRDASGDLDAIDLFSAFIAWRHVWGGDWRSTFSYSMLAADNDSALTAGATTSDVNSIRVNLINSPMPKLDVGVELSHAVRETENGADGDLDRIHFMVVYKF